jgi:O-antigen/teichoic acid export membrane protein
MAGRERLLGNALSSVVQVVMSAGLLFALYRFLNRQLTIEQIGTWSLVIASTAMGRLADFGLGAGVVRFVANDLGSHRPDMAARTIAMSTASIALTVGVVCCLLYPILWVGLAHLIGSPENLSFARSLLSYALSSLWLGSAASVMLSALDGCQRMGIKAAISLTGQAVQLACAYLVVPRIGALGIGVAQITQTVVTFVGAVLIIMLLLGQSWRIWLSWDHRRFRELISYGGKIQISAIGQLLFEPAVKAMLTKFGGLALTGYYEMANRMISQFRAIIVAALQSLVPYVAASTGDLGQVRDIYRSSYRLLVFLAIPYYSLIALLLPLISRIWLSRIDSHFLFVSLLCLVGWGLNTMVAPAYFLFLATGRLKWTVLAQCTIGASSIVVGGIAGWWFGATGVLLGSTVALAAGSQIVSIAFHHEFRIPLRELFPRESVLLVASSIGSAGTLLLIGTHFYATRFWTSTLVSVGSYLAATVFAAWRNPNRSRLYALMKQAVPAAGSRLRPPP